MNYRTARLYALAGVPVGRQSSETEADLGPTWWISFERGRWRRNDANGATLLESDDLEMADYMGTDWTTPKNWGALPAISPQPDFPDTPYYRTDPTFNVLDPRPA
jgi:hypothetical protein